METLNYTTKNIKLAAFLLSKKLCGLGKVTWGGDPNFADINLFFAEQNRIKIYDLISQYANGEVLVNLDRFSDNVRFIIRLSKEHR